MAAVWCEESLAECSPELLTGGPPVLLDAAGSWADVCVPVLSVEDNSLVLELECFEASEAVVCSDDTVEESQDAVYVLLSVLLSVLSGRDSVCAVVRL